MKMMAERLLAAAFAALGAAAFGAVMPQLPESQFADTEALGGELTGFRR